MDGTITIPTALVEQVWSKDLWYSAKKELYWNKFMGTSPDKIIQIKTDLKKDAGDKITIPLFPRLVGPGVTGDDEAEGNEEPMSFFSFNVEVDQVRKSIKLPGKKGQQQVSIDTRKAAKVGLTQWMQEYMDGAIFTALSETPSTNRVVYGGTRTTEDTLTSSDKMTAALISKTKRKAKLAGTPVDITVSGTVAVTADSYYITGSSTAFTTELAVGDVVTVSSQERVVTEIVSDTSLKVHAKWKTTVAAGASYTVKRYLGARSNMRPIKFEGKELYVMVIHPWQARDLRQDTDWINAQLNANIKGYDNPIFSGALGIYDNVIIHEHENVKISATGASSANVGHALFLGAQAGAMAVAQEPDWNEELRDYKNKIGFETGLIWGVEKAKFNNEDFGCIVVKTGAAAD